MIHFSKGKENIMRMGESVDKQKKLNVSFLHHVFNGLFPQASKIERDNSNKLQCLYRSESEAFADNKNVTKKLEFVVGWAENIVGKGENASY